MSIIQCKQYFIDCVREILTFNYNFNLNNRHRVIALMPVMNQILNVKQKIIYRNIRKHFCEYSILYNKLFA